jgi:hypothetical protein
MQDNTAVRSNKAGSYGGAIWISTGARYRPRIRSSLTVERMEAFEGDRGGLPRLEWSASGCECKRAPIPGRSQVSPTRRFALKTCPCLRMILALALENIACKEDLEGRLSLCRGGRGVQATASARVHALGSFPVEHFHVAHLMVQVAPPK